MRHQSGSFGRARVPRGFTVIELLIAAFIAMLIFGIGLTLLTGAMRARSEAQDNIRVTDSARMFFEMFERDMAGAYSGYSYRSDLITKMAGTGYYFQMATTSEERAAGSEWIMVQYYMCPGKDANKVYRWTMTGFAPGGGWSSPGYSDLIKNTYALCPDVLDLSAEFVRWEPTVKSYLRQTQGVTSDDATHLEVTVKFLNPDEKLALAKRIRTFSRYFPIPASVTKPN